MATHIIVGTGEGVDVPQSVINESLRDAIKDGDSVVMQWHGRPSKALGQVYDYIFDQQIQFELIHDTGGKIPKAFEDAKFGHVLNPNRGIVGEFAEMLSDDGHFLLIGDDPKTDELVIGVYNEVSGHDVLDLSDGLTPVKMEADEEETPEDEPVVAEIKDEDPTDATEVDDDPTDIGVEDPDPLSFSREEMESMPLRTLQRLVKNAGIESPGGNAKEPYIEVLVEAQNDDAGDVDPYTALGDGLRSAIAAVAQMQDDDPSRQMAMVATKLDEAFLWYRHGAFQKEG
jgi:hypothetical protein